MNPNIYVSARVTNKQYYKIKEMTTNIKISDLMMEKLSLQLSTIEQENITLVRNFYKNILSKTEYLRKLNDLEYIHELDSTFKQILALIEEFLISFPQQHSKKILTSSKNKTIYIRLNIEQKNILLDLVEKYNLNSTSELIISIFEDTLPQIINFHLTEEYITELSKQLFFSVRRLNYLSFNDRKFYQETMSQYILQLKSKWS